MIRIIFFMFCSMLLNSQESILNIGHRGAKGHIAENTIASIHKAIELGSDGIEIDVFLCKSGEIVLFHERKQFLHFYIGKHLFQFHLNQAQ